MSDIFDDMKRIEPSELERHGVIERARKDANGYHTYICPNCGNGTGKDGDGLTVKRHADGVFNYTCWKCTGKQYYTAVDLIAAHIGADGESKEGKAKVAEWAKSNLGLRGDEFSTSRGKSTLTKSEPIIFPSWEKLKLDSADEALRKKYLSLDTATLEAYGLVDEIGLLDDVFELVAFKYFGWTWELLTQENFPHEETMKKIFKKAKEILGDPPSEKNNPEKISPSMGETVAESAQTCAKTDDELKRLYLNLDAATLINYGLLNVGDYGGFVKCPNCDNRKATWKCDGDHYRLFCGCGVENDFQNVFDFIRFQFAIPGSSDEVAFGLAKKLFGENPKIRNDFKNLIRASWQGLKNCQNFKRRGFRALTLETLEHFRAGYFLNFYRDETPRLIIPTSFNHYFARLTMPVEKLPACVRGDEEIESKRHFGRKEIFGLKSALNALKVKPAQIVFAVEGEIDAMSIYQSGFQAIAFGGSDISDLMKEQLKKFPAGTKFIISFDGDETGAAKTPKALDAIKSCGHFVTALKLSDKYKDANEFLQADADGLKTRLTEMLNEAENYFLSQAISTSDTEKIDGVISLASYLQTDFYSEIDAAAQYSDRKSGFENLDLNQVWLPGVYLLGGLPGLGKTAFAIQLLEQFARNGETCIYCSLEMSRAEIMARIVARRNYQLDADKKNPLSTTDIRRGIFNRDKLSPVHKQLCDDLKISIMELDDEDISAIIEKLEKFCSRVESPPIVVIDYLQMIRSDKDTAKMAIDEIVRKLKNFQRKTNTTFIVISSFNRENYNEEVTFKSFKESGGIEYTADVVFGMQINTDGQGRTSANIEEGKKKNPRAVQLVCLKNRHGANYDVTFNYFPAVDTFEPAVLKIKTGDEEVIAYR